jgi:hypothetical protein
MNGRNIPATGHDILCMTVWIGTLGKALIKKGLLEKSDLITQLHELRPSCPPELQLEIDNMCKTIERW